MKNIEKYKGIVLKHLSRCDIATDIRKKGGKAAIDCPHTSCEECQEMFFKWLLEEYKEPILNDKEREYLAAAIRPFKENVCTVYKKAFQSYSGLPYEYIVVKFKLGNERWGFPKFIEGTMYKGMTLEREYSLEELGL